MSKSPVPKRLRDTGFTLLEVLISLVILTVALMSMALLAAQMLNGTRGSQFMSTAASLASAKLEDLNRWSPTDPQVCVPATGCLEPCCALDRSCSRHPGRCPPDSPSRNEDGVLPTCLRKRRVK